MPTYSHKDFGKLVARIKGKDKIVLKASKNTIDRSGRFVVSESIREIVRQVNLKASYIKAHISQVTRPTNNNLETVIRGDMNQTLLSRYPHSVTSGKTGGGSVSVNKGSSINIKGLRYVTIKGGERVIGLFNKDAVKVFRANLHKGKGATRRKLKKFRRISKRAKETPFGRTPLHSRSINQLFESVREDIQPRLGRFMRENFLKDFNRLDK